MTAHRPGFPAIGLLLFLLAGIAPSWGQGAAELPPLHEHGTHHHGNHAMPDEHAAHRAAMQQSRYSVTMESYAVPDLELLDQSGAPVALTALLEGNQPVALNFIFTTCTTICPVMTATFAQMRRALGPESDRIRLVSITIDPEHDTPAVLAGYAGHFGTPSGWSFLTGSPEDVERVLRAFDAWTGSKTNHRPITLLHRQGESNWVRLEGLGSGAALADHARTVLN
jgi:protein SCO1/2